MSTIQIAQSTASPQTVDVPLATGSSPERLLPENAAGFTHFLPTPGKSLGLFDVVSSLSSWLSRRSLVSLHIIGRRVVAAGPSVKTFNIDLIETTLDLGMGTNFAAWTYNGRIPAPVIEACEGDKVIIHMNNKGTTAHGFDTHAMKIDARHYSAVAPGKTMTKNN